MILESASYAAAAGCWSWQSAASFFLRFKKLKPNLKSSNIPTQQSMAFLLQRDLELPGIPPAMTNINAGYILNRMQTQIAASFITCPVGRRIEWAIDLAEIPLGDVVNMPPRRTGPKLGTTITGKGTKQPKRTAEKREGEDDDDDTDSKR